MNKKTKENIKQVVNSGLKLILTKLKISDPSSKMHAATKKHSKKLMEDIKKEMKRQAKNSKANAKTKAAKKSKPAKPIAGKAIK